MKIVGLAGNIGAGKNLVASMIPGATVVEWSDRLYAGLSAILGVPVRTLKERHVKENGIDVAGMRVDVRFSLQTLGTDWGRELIHPDLWVNLTLDDLPSWVVLAALPGTRFPNEVNAIRSRGGEIWWIERESALPTGHVSDHQISAGDCDRVIVNNGTVDELRARVRLACRDACLLEPVA